MIKVPCYLNTTFHAATSFLNVALVAGLKLFLANYLFVLDDCAMGNTRSPAGEGSFIESRRLKYWILRRS